MGGAFDTINAPTIEELEEKVRYWYQQASDAGLEEARHPWHPEDVFEGDGGFGYHVWAHT